MVRGVGRWVRGRSLGFWFLFGLTLFVVSLLAPFDRSTVFGEVGGLGFFLAVGAALLAAWRGLARRVRR